VSSTTNGPGSVSLDPDLPNYIPGSTVLLTATPAPGYDFIHWSGDLESDTNPIEVTVDQNLVITATFADRLPPTVDVLAPNGGEVLLVGNRFDIRWQAEDLVGVAGVDLYISRNGMSGPFDPITTGEANDGSYEWVITPPTTAQAIVAIVAHDAAANTDSAFSDTTFRITGSMVAAGDLIPTEFGLVSVAPNPARTEARIFYTLPRDADIRMTVSDVQGREVAVLARGRHAAGSHTAIWNTRRVSPGTYFIRFETPVRRWVRRIVVAR
jgi:hypothetical protein